MKTLEQWLFEYSQTHQHPTNKKIHNICVPLIMFSVIGLLWILPQPSVMDITLNWGWVFIAVCLLFYLKLSRKVFVVMFAISCFFAGLIWLMQISQIPLLFTFSTIFMLAWVGQFVGHKIEGKKPSFFQDLQFLLIGPLWVFIPPLKKTLNL